MSDTFTVRFPAALKPGLEAAARSQGFGSVAAYLAHLARVHGTGPIPCEDNPELEASLREGLESGPGIVVDDAYWKDFRRRVRTATTAKQRRRA